MFLSCCAILWIYWDRLKKPAKKKIFISADCWLCVFDLLAPSQLGLAIALISHRFDFYVDEHFKTRKWTLKSFEIQSKIKWCCAKQMEIVNFEDQKPLPIPQKTLPKKVVGFKTISINFIDRKAIAFLHRFCPLFAACPINLTIHTSSDHILEFILHNIWPMFGKNMLGLELTVGFFHRLRKFVPSILNDCPSLCALRIVKFYAHDNFFTEFPCDDSAAASDGQALAKWLFTPLQNDVPKVLSCSWDMDDGNLAAKIAAFKAAFASASSPVNFIAVVRFRSSFADPIVQFEQTNQFTQEQLALKKINDSNHFLLIRCPIARDADKWAKLEKKASAWYMRHQWNQIYIRMDDEDQIGDGLLNATPGPSDQPAAEVNE